MGHADFHPACSNPGKIVGNETQGISVPVSHNFCSTCTSQRSHSFLAGRTGLVVAPDPGAARLQGCPHELQAPVWLEWEMKSRNIDW